MYLAAISITITVLSIVLVWLIFKEVKRSENKTEILLNVSEIKGSLADLYIEKCSKLRKTIINIDFEKKKLSKDLINLEKKYKALKEQNDHNEFLLSRWITPQDPKTGKFVKKQ